MAKVKVKLIDVVDQTRLPVVELDQFPGDGDPIEINGEMYYVCERNWGSEGGIQAIGVIPLVVKNPARVTNIKSYINCLSTAHRRVQFIKEGKACDLEGCDSMTIS